MASRTPLDLVVQWFQRSLILWLIASSYLAHQWPRWAPQAVDPFSKQTFTNEHLYLTIAMTMFAIGLMLPRDEVRQVLRRWPAVLGGTTIQYTMMPLLAYLSAKLAGLTGADLIGVVMVGCVPGAMASNVLTYNAGGNTSYSVSLTTSATLLSPLAVPLAMGLTLTSEGAVDRSILLRSSGTLVWTVVLPVLAGHGIGRRLSRDAQQRVKQGGSLVANIAILVIIAVVVGRNRSNLQVVEHLGLLGTLLLVNLGGYFAGYLGGWAMKLPAAMRRALTLEIGMQNAGLGTVLALSLFPTQAEIAIAPALYTFGCMLTGTILAGIWSSCPDRARRAETARNPAEPPQDPV